MSLVTITQPAIQMALNKAEGNDTAKWYGKECPVVMTGVLRAADKKEGDAYVPTAYGTLRVRALQTTTKEGKPMLGLLIDGGLTGRVFKNDDGNKDYEYYGAVEAGNGEEFAVFGRRRKTENGSFISFNSAERRAVAQRQQSTEQAQAHADHNDDLPF